MRRPRVERPVETLRQRVAEPQCGDAAHRLRAHHGEEGAARRGIEDKPHQPPVVAVGVSLCAARACACAAPGHEIGLPGVAAGPEVADGGGAGVPRGRVAVHFDPQLRRLRARRVAAPLRAAAGCARSAPSKPSASPSTSRPARAAGEKRSQGAHHGVDEPVAAPRARPVHLRKLEGALGERAALGGAGGRVDGGADEAVGLVRPGRVHERSEIAGRRGAGASAERTGFKTRRGELRKGRDQEQEGKWREGRVPAPDAAGAHREKPVHAHAVEHHPPPLVLEGVCVVERELRLHGHGDHVSVPTSRHEVHERAGGGAALLPEALRGALLPQNVQERVDLDRVLDEDEVVFREGEVVEERVAVEVHPAGTREAEGGVVLREGHPGAHAREREARREPRGEDQLVSVACPGGLSGRTVSGRHRRAVGGGRGGRKGGRERERGRAHLKERRRPECGSACGWAQRASPPRPQGRRRRSRRGKPEEKGVPSFRKPGAGEAGAEGGRNAG